ncbi:MAG: DmsE family decaheme c-type cytochrome [Acetobacteraceae bacterium]|jgi:DmsE family decaheme c-type cytochrome
MKQRLVLKLLVGIALTLGAFSASAQPRQAMTPGQIAAQDNVKTCLTCHGGDPKVTAILQSPMATLGDQRTPFAQGGCEGCHGNSAAHMAGKAPFPAVVFKGPNASPVAVRNEVCASCHRAGLQMNWKGSAHEENNKACTDCHTAHAAKDPVLVKLTQADVCFTCHARERADSFKYSHHPMREGKVVCSDCHNPHGSPGDTKLLKEFTINETCYNCHADKRGPLLWEHQPVRDNCVNCHNPHGSNEPRLLVERMNFLCSSCHSSQANSSGGAFGGHGAIPFRGPGSTRFSSALANQRTCINCHSQVHGSNSPSGAFFFR